MIDGELVPYGPLQVELIGTQGALMSTGAGGPSTPVVPSAVAQSTPAAVELDALPLRAAAKRSVAAAKDEGEDARTPPSVDALLADEAAARVPSDAAVEEGEQEVEAG